MMREVSYGQQGAGDDLGTVPGENGDMNVARWTVESTREKGMVQTAKIAGNVVCDLFFDWRHGTDTMRWLDRDALEAGSENQAHSAPYRATKVGPFLRLLKKLNLPQDSTFIDIGSGKGRVLLMACQYGFRKVVGIEFSPRLCEIARKNVELYARKKTLRTRIEVTEADATKYQFRADDRVFFMYNPFDGVVLAQVLNRIRDSLRDDPRQIWLIYNTPLHHDMIRSAGVFRSDVFYEIGGTHFRVYAN